MIDVPNIPLIARQWVFDVHGYLNGWPHRVWIASGDPLGIVAALGMALEAPALDRPPGGKDSVRIRTLGALHIMMEAVPGEFTTGLTVPPDRAHPLLDAVLSAATQMLQVELAGYQRLLQTRALAHEIRNPLTLLSGYAELLEHQGEYQLGRLILDEVRRIDQDIEEFLQAGRPLEPVAVDLSHLVEEVIRRFGQWTEKEGIALSLQSEPVTVMADRAHLEKVLNNLIRNALESMPNGGQLSVQVRPVAGGAELVVQDTGPGIAREVEAELFRPYFSTKAGGHGLGLALTWDLVTRHGGRIESLSVENGAAFRVWLPERLRS